MYGIVEDTEARADQVPFENGRLLTSSNCIYEILVYAGLSFATSFGNCGFCVMVLWHLANYLVHRLALSSQGRERALASDRALRIQSTRDADTRCGHSTENEQGTISIEYDWRRVTSARSIAPQTKT